MPKKLPAVFVSASVAPTLSNHHFRRFSPPASAAAKSDNSHPPHPRIEKPLRIPLFRGNVQGLLFVMDICFADTQR